MGFPRDRITVVVIDGRADRALTEANLIVLEWTQQLLGLGPALLFSHLEPSWPVDGVAWVPIEPITSRGQFSDWVVCHLADYIETSHVLMCHEDGFAVNLEHWTDEFLEYDFVGAPWPLSWFSPEHRVGNGGFSLRSKRLLHYLQCNRDRLWGLSGQYRPEHQPNEDLHFCVHRRTELESVGFRWPSVELAAQFSMEWPIPERPHEVGQSFGWHGRQFQVWHTYLDRIGLRIEGSDILPKGPRLR